jgi:hypothetical protein
VLQFAASGRSVRSQVAPVLVAGRTGLGGQPAARQRIEPLLDADFATNRRLHIVRYRFDQRLVTHCYRARIVCVQGFPDRAFQSVADVLEFARAADHMISLLYVLLEGACPLPLNTGQFAAAHP